MAQLSQADFDDITGWREEIEAYRKTDEGREFLDRYRVGMGRKLPILSREIPLHISELMLADDELRAALEHRVIWEEVLDDPSNPYEESEHYEKALIMTETLTEFEKWYAMKSQAPYSMLVWGGAVLGITLRVLRGELPGVRSRETYEFLRKKYSHRFR